MTQTKQVDIAQDETIQMHNCRITLISITEKTGEKTGSVRLQIEGREQSDRIEHPAQEDVDSQIEQMLDDPDEESVHSENEETAEPEEPAVIPMLSSRSPY